MHSTLLNLMREDEVLNAIKTCWSSLFRPRVLSYLRALVRTFRFRSGS